MLKPGDTVSWWQIPFLAIWGLLKLAYEFIVLLARRLTGKR